eukprot:933840-Prymnesium_polylepis.1
MNEFHSECTQYACDAPRTHTQRRNMPTSYVTLVALDKVALVGLAAAVLVWWRRGRAQIDERIRALEEDAKRVKEELQAQLEAVGRPRPPAEPTAAPVVVLPPQPPASVATLVAQPPADADQGTHGTVDGSVYRAMMRLERFDEFEQFAREQRERVKAQSAFKQELEKFKRLSWEEECEVALSRLKQWRRRRHRPSGLSWRKVDAQHAVSGQRVVNDKLAAALATRTEFTQDEWKEFDVHDLRVDSYVKSGDAYFQPQHKRQLLEVVALTEGPARRPSRAARAPSSDESPQDAGVRNRRVFQKGIDKAADRTRRDVQAEHLWAFGAQQLER